MATVTTARSVAPSTSSNSFSGASRTLPKLDCALDCAVNDSFPAGLRVLVVDDDPICLLILDRMLQRCQYKVTTCGRAADALAMLRENREIFDVIISDVYMPDMDGFKLLELVGLEMDLPVIMMSANGETSAVMKGIKHGACDYLLKPVRMEELRNIWQHVVRKKWRSSTHLAAADDDERGRHARNDGDHQSSVNEGYDGLWKPGKKRRELKEEEDDTDVDPEDSSTTKKPRVVWSVELHQQFVNAVHQLGIDKAFPKRILELMNVHGLTRENVASHLQKYRLYLKRINGVTHQSGAMSPSFPVSSDSSFGPTSAVTGGNVGDFRAIVGSNGLPSEALLAGVLGRLNQGNNLGIGNVEKPNLLQLAALQGVDTGTLNQASFVPSYGQTALNDPAVLQAGQCDVSPVQLAQLGALTGIALDKLPLGLSSLQQLHLESAVGLGALGQLLGAGNFPQVNPNNSALIMQALQQQQGGNHPLSKNGLSGSGGQLGTLTDAGSWVTAISNLNGNIRMHNPLPLQYSVSSRLGSTAGACPGPTMPGPLACAPAGDQECEGQQGLSTDARVWGPSLSNLNRAGLNRVGNAVNAIGSQNSQLLEIGSSESPLPGSLENPYDVESKCSVIPNHGNVTHVNPLSVSSSMAVSGPDNLLYNRMKDLKFSLPSLNSMAAQNPGPRFPAIPGMRQAPQVSQRAQGTRPGFGLSQDFVQASNSTIQSPGYSSGGSSTNQGFPLVSDQEQSDVCRAGLNSGFASDFNIDTNHLKNFQVDQLTVENISKVGVGGGGHGWVPEPISDELLSFVLQQQQEGLGLTE